jgi:hypothetical protein
MRRPSLLAATAILASAFVLSTPAHADSMDPALERLMLPVPDLAKDPSGKTPIIDPSTMQPMKCANVGHYRPGTSSCLFDNVAFKRLISQYGFAFAPTGMYPARTTGYGGFQISLQASYTSIDADADYWKKGTQGPKDPNTGQYSIENKSPDSWLQYYNLNVRKGFPFGFELGANVGFMSHTTIVSGGVDVRWALLEGFRSSLLGILPDISIGAGVRTITNSPQFQLTVASGDAIASKPIPIADSSVLTPYIGYQFIRIFGDSGLIDATPNTDPLGYCNYQGQNVPGTPDSKPPYNGQPICSGAPPDDLNNTKTFERTRITRHRLIAGLSYRYEMVVLGGQFMTDIVDPGDANSDAEAEALKGISRQNVITLQIGTAF